MQTPTLRQALLKLDPQWMPSAALDHFRVSSQPQGEKYTLDQLHQIARIKGYVENLPVAVTVKDAAFQDLEQILSANGYDELVRQHCRSKELLEDMIEGNLAAYECLSYDESLKAIQRLSPLTSDLFEKSNVGRMELLLQSLGVAASRDELKLGSNEKYPSYRSLLYEIKLLFDQYQKIGTPFASAMLFLNLFNNHDVAPELSNLIQDKGLPLLLKSSDHVLKKALTPAFLDEEPDLFNYYCASFAVFHNETDSNAEKDVNEIIEKTGLATIRTLIVRPFNIIGAMDSFKSKPQDYENLFNRFQKYLTSAKKLVGTYFWPSFAESARILRTSGRGEEGVADLKQAIALVGEDKIQKYPSLLELVLLYAYDQPAQFDDLNNLLETMESAAENFGLPKLYRSLGIFYAEMSLKMARSSASCDRIRGWNKSLKDCRDAALKNIERAFTLGAFPMYKKMRYDFAWLKNDKRFYDRALHPKDR